MTERELFEQEESRLIRMLIAMDEETDQEVYDRVERDLAELQIILMAMPL